MSNPIEHKHLQKPLLMSAEKNGGLVACLHLLTEKGQPAGLYIDKISHITETDNFFVVKKLDGCTIAFPIGRILEVRTFPAETAPTKEELCETRSEKAN